MLSKLMKYFYYYINLILSQLLLLLLLLLCYCCCYNYCYYYYFNTDLTCVDGFGNVAGRESDATGSVESEAVVCFAVGRDNFLARVLAEFHGEWRHLANTVVSIGHGMVAFAKLAWAAKIEEALSSVRK